MVVLLGVDSVEGEYLIIGPEKCVCREALALGKVGEVLLRGDNNMVEDFDIWVSFLAVGRLV